MRGFPSSARMAESRRTGLQPPSRFPSQAGRGEVRAILSGNLSSSAGVGSPLDDRFDGEMVYAIAPITSGGDIAAAVRVAVPLSQVQPHINRLIASIAVAALLVGMLSVGVGYFLFRRLRAPCAPSPRERIGSRKETWNIA